jgi:hypothetical protein
MLCTECHIEVTEKNCFYDKVGNPYHAECFIRIAVNPIQYREFDSYRRPDPSIQAAGVMMRGNSSKMKL